MSSDTKSNTMQLIKLRHDLANAYLALCDFIDANSKMSPPRSIPLDKQSLKLLNEMKIELATEVLDE